ncbi:MAG TPA: FAD-binding oxidoreductase [Rhodanobacteraceae bacterium]|nr:FAD-binding oxidoreductase [Rhodanobacteraceae bacterium]
MSRAPTWYAASAGEGPRFAPLQGRNEVDIALVGGGFAGLDTALSLAERGVRGVAVLEAEDVGFGASGRNGGFVFAGYSLGEQALLDRLGEDHAQRLFARTTAAVDLVRQRITRHGIDCDPVDRGVIWANWFDDPRVLRDRQRLLADHYGVEWEWLPRERLREMLRTPRYSDGLFERNALHIHPLKYVFGLARAASALGVAIHENSRVRRLQRDGEGWLLRCAGGELHARRVVLACGGYLAGLQRRVDRAVLPIATCVMVTEPLGARLDEAIATPAAVYDTRFAFDYYRKLADTRLLWGGRISVRNPSVPAIKRQLRRDLARVYPQLADARIDHAWSGLMSYARHEMPQLGTDGQGLWWAQAFGGHGLAPTTAAGELLAAALANDDPAWREFADFGLAPTFRPLGYLGAQARYGWLQMKDRLKEALER